MIEEPMTPEQIADYLVQLPMKRVKSDTTTIEIVSGSGYLERFAVISEDLIRKRLALEPSVVDEWIAYSEDKRVQSGWYLRCSRNGRYEVGYFNGLKQRPEHVETYDDKVWACAKFMKEELEEIRRQRPDK